MIDLCQDLPTERSVIKESLFRYAVIFTRRDVLKLVKMISRKFKLEESKEVAEAMSEMQIIARWVCEIEA